MPQNNRLSKYRLRGIFSFLRSGISWKNIQNPPNPMQNAAWGYLLLAMQNSVAFVTSSTYTKGLSWGKKESGAVKTKKARIHAQMLSVAFAASDTDFTRISVANKGEDRN